MYSISHTCFFLSKQVLWLTPGTLHFYIRSHGWEHLCLPRWQTASQWRLEVTLKVQPGNLLKTHEDNWVDCGTRQSCCRHLTWLIVEYRNMTLKLEWFYLYSRAVWRVTHWLLGLIAVHSRRGGDERTAGSYTGWQSETQTWGLGGLGHWWKSFAGRGREVNVDSVSWCALLNYRNGWK